MRTSVLKFGGSTFESLEDYARVARYLRRRIATGERLVVVASAMAGLTEWLRGHATALGDPPDPEASDALLPLADTASAAMLSLALRRCGVRSATLAGHQLGITTDDRHTRARVQRVDAGPLLSALERGPCVVVPGAQGVTAQNVPTSLGKNSSDLSAALLAGALGIARCEIFSDASGVYSGDPKYLRGVRLIERISYARLHQLSLSGAKVMHHGAVAAAAAASVELVCRSNRGGYRVGTLVTASADPDLPAVVLDPRSALLRFASDDDLAGALRELTEFGVPTVAPAAPHERLLAITCGYFDPLGFLRERGIAAEPTGYRLISEFAPGGEVRRHVVHDEHAQLAAQQLHDLHYAAPEPQAELRALEAV